MQCVCICSPHKCTHGVVLMTGIPQCPSQPCAISQECFPIITQTVHGMLEYLCLQEKARYQKVQWYCAISQECFPIITQTVQWYCAISQECFPIITQTVHGMLEYLCLQETDRYQKVTHHIRMYMCTYCNLLSYHAMSSINFIRPRILILESAQQ